jgi:esterase
MAAAVYAWIGQQGRQGAWHVVGHSLGGKVAMRLALDHPQAVRSLVIADIAPVSYPSHHDDVFAALRAVADAGCESRTAAAALMAEHLAEDTVIQFLLLSLRRGDDGRYQWRFNLDGLQRDYAALREGLVAGAPYAGPVLFVKGGESNYIRAAHRETTARLFPASRLRVMAGCGHWLHAEQPERFNQLVVEFLDAVESQGVG